MSRPDIRSRSAAGLLDGVDTILEVVQQHRAGRPDGLAYTFQPGRGEQEQRWNWTELDRRARAIAAELQQAGRHGQPVLVLQPAGLEYVACFLGCLYAGAIAVPAYPPDGRRMGQSLARLAAIAADSRTTLALTSSQVAEFAEGSRDQMVAIGLGAVRWLATDGIDDGAAEQWRRPDVRGGNLALLQYTSGSTATPKGVMVSNANLLANLDSIHRRLGHDETSGMVSWLPPFHDMGLIGGILSPLYGGFPAHLMAPETFVARPLLWLQTLSRTGASTSVAPNFGFEHCLRRIGPDELAGLDLSSWRLALNGAEPVRAETLARFAAYVASTGFQPSALLPCYGLAEASLMVTGVRAEEPPRVLTLDGSALGASAVRPPGPGSANRTRVVSCGPPVAGVELAVVDPDQGRRLPADQVGEIWVSGASVARGYWRRPAESADTFRAELADAPGRFWLRTGDLGFLSDGELFVAGRIKDVVILSGRNVYPQDVEQTVERCDPAIRQGAGAAFGITVGGEEQLVVAVEIDRQHSLDTGALLARIRSAIASEHEITPHAVVLLKRSSVPKTTSGKVQRQICRTAFLQLQLEVLAASVVRDAGGQAAAPRATGPATPISAEWVAEQLSASLGRGVRAAELRTGTLAELSIDYRCLLQLASNQPAGFQLGDLLTVRTGEQLLAAFGVGAAQTTPATQRPGDALEVERWLRAAVADRLAVPISSVDPTLQFTALGLDSKNAVGIADELGRLLGRPLDASTIFDHPSVRAVAHAVTGSPHAGTAPTGSLGPRTPQPGSRTGDPVAIVGIGCRLPGAADVDGYWRLLLDGRDATGPVPAQRWDAAAAGTPDRGGFLDDVAGFDARLFGISAREADRMDPQQRLLLEVAWQAFEDAGIAASSLRGSSVGVFVGISSGDYAQLGSSAGDVYDATGNCHALAANRISYVFDLHGPSMAIDTACSSSLVGVHLAVRSLRAGDCELALAGGVNVMLTPGLSTAFGQAGMLAPDGRCRTFDAAADGYVRGEGAALLCLKRLSVAVADGDRIYGVIRGSSIGHGGRGNGITAPRAEAQQRVIRAALTDAGLAAEQVDYVEAHGTGTALGDPIEWESLAQVYGSNRPAACLVGSVKPAIGHLEAAAGVAGLVKAALVLHHRHAPGQLHFGSLNPRMRTASVALRVAERAYALPECGPLYSAVSSFGFGGANAHMVLETAPVPVAEQPVPERSTHALALSAHTGAALRRLADRYRLRLATEPAPDLATLCATANTGRSPLGHRAVLIAADRTELEAGLVAVSAGEAAEQLVTAVLEGANEPPRVGMLFSGQGSQHARMGRQLYESHAGFRASLDAAAEVLQDELDRPLLDLLLSDNGDELRRTRYCQPALVAFQLALAELWATLGIVPVAVLGHSVGALAAASVAGVLPAEDALRLAAARGRLMDEQPGDGAMLACSGDEQVVRSIVAELGGLAIAAENAPGQLVLSGHRPQVEAAESRLARSSVATRRLAVSHAFHSELMAGAAAGLRAATDQLSYQPARLDWISDATGELVEQVAADYWVGHLLNPVRFGAAMGRLLDRCDTFVEIGPHPGLLSLGRRAVADRTDRPARWLPSLRRDADDWRTLLRSVAELQVNGAPVRWSGLDVGRRRPRIDVPHTVLERDQHWRPDARPITHPEGSSMPSPATSQPASGQPPVAGPATGEAEPVGSPADLVRGQVARISGFAADRVPTRSRLGADLGFDSLMKTELHRALVRQFPAAEAVLREQLPQDPTVEHIVRLLGGRPTTKLAPAEFAPVNAAPADERPEATRSGSAERLRSDRFEDWPEYRELQDRLRLAEASGTNPYGRIHDGFNSGVATVSGRRMLNFSAFNYLALSNHPRLRAAAKAAIDRYGTSSSATPLLCGETPLHHELDAELAAFLGTEAAIVFAGGHATNVATVGHLFGPDDLIVHDAWIHDSSVRGAILSGARRRPFPHNDWRALDELLTNVRSSYQRVLVLIEGAYSQDGDLPDLPEFIRVKQRHAAMLMIDEAHSIGVLGRTGRGVGEHFGVDRADVDLWMGTLSKGLGSLGGYVAAQARIIEYLRFTTPLYIFSTGISPANAAAALEALRVVQDEPERVRRLQELADYFRNRARQRGFDIGVSRASAVVPVILGDWDRAMRISNRLLADGVNVMPIGYPAVDPDACRLRFFVNVDHTEADLDSALDLLGTAMSEYRNQASPSDQAPQSRAPQSDQARRGKRPALPPDRLAIRPQPASSPRTPTCWSLVPPASSVVT